MTDGHSGFGRLGSDVQGADVQGFLLDRTIPARYPVTALPEPEFEIREQDIPFQHKYLVSVLLNTKLQRNLLYLDISESEYQMI